MSMAFTTPNHKFIVISHGNGWAYEVHTNPQTERSLWFQDGDAAQLQQESEDFTNESFIEDYFACLFN